MQATSGRLRGKAVGGGEPRPLDEAEARRALAILADPAAGIELRALPSGRSVVHKGTDLDALAKAAAIMAAEGQQVYYTLNPVPADLGRAARVKDVLRRRWLLIDVDPVRAPGHDKECATEKEKEVARAVALAIADALHEEYGWPAPVVIDSGNGVHLLYRVDLENTAHAQAVLKRVLYALASQFDDGNVTVDRAVHNASRVAKLPGSWSRKGAHSEERPWRPVRLLNAPSELHPISLELLNEVGGVASPAGEANGHAEPKASKGIKGRAAGGEDGGRRWAEAALEREAARILLAPAGERNNTLNRAAFALGQIVAAGLLERSRVEETLALAASRAGLAEGEIGPTLRSGLEAGIAAGPRKPPERPGKAKAAEARTEKPTGSEEPVIVRASSIRPRAVEWLWPDRIPLGKLTTFAGVGGLGKTFVLCDITARVTNGTDWPDSPPDGPPRPRGQVLFISGEDDPEDTLVPRLIEVGADLDRVAFLTPSAEGDFNLAALQTLTAALGQIGEDTRLVVIDPPSSYLAGVDDHKNAELRSLLTPLAAWARQKRVSIVFNTHVNKPQGAKVEAMMRVMGSVAWVNGVRAAHMFARDPEDRTKRVFVPMKNNLGEEKKGLCYRLVKTECLARVEWLGEVETTADEAVSRDTRPRKRSVAASAWLEEVFEGRVEIPSKEIFDRQEKETTISANALREAKDEMGIKAKQMPDGDGAKCWFWIWPPEAKCRWRDKQKSNGAQRDDEIPL